MKFSEINLENIDRRGYHKTLVLRNEELLVGGKTTNLIMYTEILKDKEVVNQFSEQDVWVIVVR